VIQTFLASIPSCRAVPEASRTRPHLIGKKRKMRKTNAVTAFPSSSAEDNNNLRVYNLAFEGTEINSAVRNETILYTSSEMLLTKSIHFCLLSALQQFSSEST
jgi:hypothetical protein